MTATLKTTRVKELAHIATLHGAEKQAANITHEQLVSDEYHATVADAAQLLVRMGAGALYYATQWTSGATLWVDDLRDPTTWATVNEQHVRFAGRR